MSNQQHSIPHNENISNYIELQLKYTLKGNTLQGVCAAESISCNFSIDNEVKF